MTDIPHFALPFRFVTLAGGIQVAVNDQDTEEEIHDCVEAIIRYEAGQRPEAPDFGIDAQVFHVPVDPQPILEQIRDNEPRVDALVSSEPDLIDNLITHVVVSIAKSPDVGTTGGNSA